MQVLQEELQQAGSQAKCPRSLVTPWGLDPWAQVLYKNSLYTGPALRATQEGRRPRPKDKLSILAGPGFGGCRDPSRTPVVPTVGSAAAHPCPLKVAERDPGL